MRVGDTTRAHVRLDAPEESVAGLLDRMMFVHEALAPADDELQLARVAPPGRQQALGGQGCGRIVAAADHRIGVPCLIGDALPQLRGRVK